MSKDINKIKKIFYLFILLSIILFVSISYLLKNINDKSTKMLQHRTFVAKNISEIKFHLAESHLWLIEYVSGDEGEKNYFEKETEKTATIIQKLIDFEKDSNQITHSKYRDNKKILFLLENIQREHKILIEWGKIQFLYRSQVSSDDDIKFDEKYKEILKKLSSFEMYLNRTFQKVEVGFKSFKERIFILIGFLAFTSFTIAYIIMKNEITKIKVIKEQEEQLKVQTENKIDAISKMLGNIAHQWRQPLSMISTSASGLKLDLMINQNVDIEHLDKNLDFIVDKTKYLSKIIEDFKSFFDSESSKNKKEIFDIKDTLEETLSSLNTEFTNHQIKVSQEISSFKVHNNETQLRQVFFNILNNSIEALKKLNQKDKFIFIKTDIINDKEITITIQDNAKGVGENIDKVFEPYFTTNHQSQGTGLGLFFVHEIITKYYNGEIKARDITVKNLKGLEINITLRK